MEVTMREIARIERGSIYNTVNFGNSKSNLTKLPIILCAIAGILLGGLVYKAANGRINFSQEAIMDTLFEFCGMDRYDPITVVNANNTYFKAFYEDKYLGYVAQMKQEELVKKAGAEKTVQVIENKIQKAIELVNEKSQSGKLKEVSSSITFEGDVEEADKKNSPVVSSGEIKILNGTKYTIDINKLLKEPLKLSTKKGPQVLVFHTHTTEAFLKSIDELTMKNIPSRTNNNNYNVVRVGDALINNLKKYNINVLHNTTVHDKDYNSSYEKSLKTLTSYVDKYPSLNMVIDLHRDAAGDDKLRVVKNINGKNVAQIMFVIGTDCKLSNTKWKENLKLAVKIQARLNEICPGVAKPIYLSPKRYNQHLTNGSVIIEIGGDGNVIDECIRSTNYLAQAINDVMYKNK
jgi:stage II sporulation protein P